MIRAMLWVMSILCVGLLLTAPGCGDDDESGGDSDSDSDSDGDTDSDSDSDSDTDGITCAEVCDLVFEPDITDEEFDCVGSTLMDLGYNMDDCDAVPPTTPEECNACVDTAAITDNSCDQAVQDCIN